MQVRDRFEYGGEVFSILYEEKWIPFDTRSYGLEPFITSTGCYRGWVATYQAVCGIFQLADLEANHSRQCVPDDVAMLAKLANHPEAFHDKPKFWAIIQECAKQAKDVASAPVAPMIAGVAAVEAGKESICRFIYKNVALPINYTGAIIVAKDWVSNCYSGGRPPDFWNYNQVIELEFIDGKLNRVKDQSKLAKTIRNNNLELALLGISGAEEALKAHRWLDRSLFGKYPRFTRGRGIL